MSMNVETLSQTGISSWFFRDYASTERYKALARSFYLATVIHPDGDGHSEQARETFAAYLSSLKKKKDNKLWVIKAFNRCRRRTVGWTLGGRQKTTRLQRSGDCTAK
jgi:hypothetical protein